jgi:hypothetical protein
MTDRWSELSPEAVQTIRSWAPMGFVSSPHLAKTLALSAQALKNWRCRGLGPVPEPRGTFGAQPPIPTYYRVSSVLAWLDDAPHETAWTYERDWLVATFPNWRFTSPGQGAIDISAALDERQTHIAAEGARAECKDLEYWIKWPERQPRRRPNLVWAKNRNAETVVTSAP